MGTQSSKRLRQNLLDVLELKHRMLLLFIKGVLSQPRFRENKNILQLSVKGELKNLWLLWHTSGHCFQGLIITCRVFVILQFSSMCALSSMVINAMLCVADRTSHFSIVTVCSLSCVCECMCVCTLTHAQSHPRARKQVSLPPLLLNIIYVTE